MATFWCSLLGDNAEKKVLPKSNLNIIATFGTASLRTINKRFNFDVDKQVRCYTILCIQVDRKIINQIESISKAYVTIC
ncbi:hypothetical protein T4D_14731 [Trichinella pseudospiralis]|uniref:Uncharacterized protein n=1 Tax=Trichinella pseudospiralis TaxID=6337 RepID=A0A0V1FQ17_TRIPS|nr:hypothetical protein T4D_14731 [Trichinella pseudospiralis]